MLNLFGNLAHYLACFAARAKLAVVRVAALLIAIPRPTVLLGEDSALRLCEFIAQLGLRRVLIVTDSVLHQLGVIDPLEAHLKALKIEAHTFSGVTPDPTVSVVNSGLSALRMAQCDAVLAVGGGSSIDAAKVIALSAANNRLPQELIGLFKSRKSSLPLFVIPTTAGTGSEVTIGAVISDDQSHQKGIVIDPRVVPLATAIDPLLMRGMPRKVTAETGIDALTHALESWMSEWANAQTDFYAGAAVRLIFTFLPRACADGKDIEARTALGMASHYAGIALNQAGLGYVHAIAHQLGAFYGLPHGRSNAIVLPHVLAFNREVSRRRLAELARKTGLVEDSASDQLATDFLIDRVKLLLREVGIDARVPAINPAHVPTMVKGAFAEAHGTYAVPRYMTQADVVGVLSALQAAPE